MLKKALNGGLTGLTAISVVFLAAAAILSTYNALARSFFSFSSPWIEELSCYLAALIMFLMAPRLEYMDEQLSISFLDEKLKAFPLGRRILFYIRGVLTLFLYAVLLRAGYKVVARNLQIGSKSPVLHVLYGQLYMIVLVALILVILYWVFHFFLKDWGGGKLNEPR
ncbi:MAG: TRAP transporter small permease subunit [Clostridiales Family XIII bacterium]|jgi:TRAP-type C4-dicarboxylate transport system permease small subunit|nr:TRAP transporter small permease subunit [Clostridiales Family XIII bacterium]